MSYPSSSGYTGSCINAGFYPVGESERYQGHSTEVSASERVRDLSTWGDTILTRVIDDAQRGRDALELLRGLGGKHGEFARRVLAGEPVELAKGCLA